MQSLIVFSQYRWDFALRRPQHVMTRLAADYRVFYFEEPVYDPRGAWLEIRVPVPNVHVCRPHTRIPERGFADSQMPLLAELLENLISSHDLGTPTVWMYTPMALPLLQRLDARNVVYDCIDEPVLNEDLARERAHRELSLLRLADLVFTGGPSLFRLKQPLHDNVHCLPGSVDKEHFGRAASAGDHPEQAGLARPRLGYFGVIDARFDPVTVALLADAHPGWQIVLVGPVGDIDPAGLPRRPNIHYMGERPYGELPQFLAGWDLCLLPFAAGPLTRHASPTKVLEYMAAGKPIVTAALPDVIEPYGHIVHVGRHSQAFVAACERALGESALLREKRAAMMRNVVKATSWDQTTARMRAQLDEISQRQQKRRVPHVPATPLARRHAVVVGAGPAGLSAAYHLGQQSLLLEQHERVGGSCRSFEVQGFNFDHGGESLLSGDPYVREMLAMLAGDKLAWRAAAPRDNGETQHDPAKPGAMGIQTGGGVGGEDRDPGGERSRPPEAHGAWSAAGGVGARRAGSLNSAAARIVHPRDGGLQSLMEGFLPQLRGELRLNARVARIAPSKRLVVLADGTGFEYEQLVSTVALPALIDLLGEEAPTRVKRAAAELRHESARWVFLGVARGARVQSPGATLHGDLVRRVIQPGPRMLACEVRYSRREPLPADGDALVDRCIVECIRLGLLEPDAPLIARHQFDLPFARVDTDPAQQEAAGIVRQWLSGRDIELAGEYAEWSADPVHPFIAGKLAAERLEDAQSRREQAKVAARGAPPRFAGSPAVS